MGADSWKQIDDAVREWNWGGEADAREALRRAVAEAWQEGFAAGQERAKRSVDPVSAAVISVASPRAEWLEKLRREMIARGCTEEEAEMAVAAEAAREEEGA